MAEDQRKIDEMIKEAREIHKEIMDELDYELSCHFTKKIAQYENIGVGCCNIVKVEDAVYYSPKEVLSSIRGEENENDYDWFEPTWA